MYTSLLGDGKSSVTIYIYARTFCGCAILASGHQVVGQLRLGFFSAIIDCNMHRLMLQMMCHDPRSKSLALDNQPQNQNADSYHCR